MSFRDWEVRDVPVRTRRWSSGIAVTEDSRAEADALMPSCLLLPRRRERREGENEMGMGRVGWK